MSGESENHRRSGYGSSANQAANLTAGRVPPHHIEAEKSVLGAILVRNEALYEVVEIGISSQDFYLDSHRKIFEVLIALSERSQPLDLVTLSAALRDRQWYDSVGGGDALTGLFEDSFAVGNVSHYARIVRDQAILRRMIESCNEIAHEAFEGVEDVEGFLDGAESKVFAVAKQKQTQSLQSMQQIVLENMQSIEKLSQKKQTVVGLPTGFTEFDRITNGLHPGQLVIIAGRPAMGKSCLVISAAQYAAVNHGAVVAIFSLEMSKDEVGFRILSGLSRIESKRLKVGRLGDKDWPKLVESADRLSKSKIWIDDSGDLSVMEMRARCRRLKSMQKRLDLVVVDYLQLMKASKAARGGGDFSREREISEISRNLKSLSKELQVPIIALSQLNRGVESRQDKRPMLSDLRESGAIEQDADMVCFIYRDEVYNRDTEDKGVAELIVAKHRSGENGVVRLAWLADYTLFANLATGVPGTPVITRKSLEQDDITL